MQRKVLYIFIAVLVSFLLQYFDLLSTPIFYIGLPVVIGFIGGMLLHNVYRIDQSADAFYPTATSLAFFYALILHATVQFNLMRLGAPFDPIQLLAEAILYSILSFIGFLIARIFAYFKFPAQRI